MRVPPDDRKTVKAKGKTMGRYRQVLLPCEATSRSYHNAIVSSADSIVALYDCLERGLNWDQVWIVKDERTGKTMTREEFYSLVNRLKGWDK